MDKPHPGNESTRPTTMVTFQARSPKQNLLRIIACGSTDDGKSTLVEHLLREALQLSDDQLAPLLL